MPRRISPEPEGALYVRLPATAFAKLDRASEALGVHKKDLIAGLVARYVDPDSRRGLTELTTLSQPRRVPTDLGGISPELGSYSFQPHDPPDTLVLPEVMTAEQTAALLQIEARSVTELAEAGQLPGRKLGKLWRFSRAAVIAWLAGPER